MARFDENEDVLFTPSVEYKNMGFMYEIVDESDYIEPVTTQEFKDFADIDYSTDDKMLLPMLKRARLQTERFLKRSLGVRTVRFSAIECKPYTRLQWVPVDSVITSGVIIKNEYLVEGGKDIEVEFITNASFMNQDIKFAILTLATDIYSNRDRFLSRYRETGQLVDKWKDALKPYRQLVFP
jgi:hypothetical protein